MNSPLLLALLLCPSVWWHISIHQPIIHFGIGIMLLLSSYSVLIWIFPNKVLLNSIVFFTVMSRPLFQSLSVFQEYGLYGKDMSCGNSILLHESTDLLIASLFLVLGVTTSIILFGDFGKANAKLTSFPR